MCRTGPVVVLTVSLGLSALAVAAQQLSKMWQGGRFLTMVGAGLLAEPLPVQRAGGESWHSD
jgi:hypothetical protein